MGDTPQLIERSFRELIVRKHFRSITVKEVCARAGVSRKTFYTHFIDKESIVELAFRRDVLQPVFDLGRLLDDDELEGLSLSVFSRMFRAVHDDGEYYRQLVAPMRGTDFTFLNMATSQFRDLYQRLLDRLDRGRPVREAEYVVFYFASAHAEFMQRWICEGFPISSEQAAEVFVDAALPFWKSLNSRHRSSRPPAAPGASSDLMRSALASR